MSPGYDKTPGATPNAEPNPNHNPNAEPNTNPNPELRPPRVGRHAAVLAKVVLSTARRILSVHTYSHIQIFTGEMPDCT